MSWTEDARDKLRAENAELRATIEHLRAVCRLAVSDGHATPYLTRMIDQAVKANDVLAVNYPAWLIVGEQWDWLMKEEQ